MTDFDKMARSIVGSLWPGKGSAGQNADIIAAALRSAASKAAADERGRTENAVIDLMDKIDQLSSELDKARAEIEALKKERDSDRWWFALDVCRSLAHSWANFLEEEQMEEAIVDCGGVNPNAAPERVTK